MFVIWTIQHVKSEHLSSEFLGKTWADDVFSKYDACLSQLDKSKILQISSDGPNVKLAFLDLVHEYRKEELLDH